MKSFSVTERPDDLDSASLPDLGDNAIVVQGLTKSFGKIDVLKRLDMRVPTGSVYALLGRNGVGKSTLIQYLMGILEAMDGDVRVLGHNPARDGVTLKQRIGYIPERMPMYDWMTVDETLKFVAPCYANWSMDDEDAMVARFRIRREQKVGALSRGNRALLSLVIAMAHRPDLVLLDECTSGMDAITRKEFERSVIDSLQQQGRTILFAGHQIDEMERICDWVGILQGGRMLLEMPLDRLKEHIRLLRVATEDAIVRDFHELRVLTRRSMGRETLLVVQGAESLAATDVGDGKAVAEAIPITLEEIFTAIVEAEES